MIQIPRWKAGLILVVCVLAFCYAAPNMVGKDIRAALQGLPGWLPTKTVSLGLDLQGGSHLLLEVDVPSVVKERAEGIVSAARTELRTAKIGYTRISPIQNGARLSLRDATDADAAKKILREVDRDVDVIVGADGKTLEATFTDAALKQITDQTIGQSIEIVRRRVDETGTREPVITRQGEDRIIVQLPGVEDPQYIKDILGRTAKLSFHLVDLKGGSEGGGVRVLPMMEDPARKIALERRAMLTGDMLTNAQYCTTQYGQSAVCFNLNGIGAKKFCRVTREHTNEPFAIVLDNQVISAPNINGPICGGAGQITGAFSVQEANDFALLLRAGALPAPLHVLEERTVGPSLGADSVQAGKMASLVGLAFILVFMGVSYGLFGMMANMALVVNMALIFALLSGLQATLTLPGIAGIVLTIGMAVDANVLIFERIREELRKGRSPIAAVDAGYARAMATIIDSNLTSLIAALILFSFGTGPIKGFAVTLGIGIVTSFFSAIWVTRLMVVSWLQWKKPAAIPV
ncbi:MAG: protein translocase subunit SecD [Alphaproteobacteria bacterium]|nr:protein translocase subunit SecD [Alphaproteobacteria bacterium]